jgi:hypothetical protein
MHELARVLLAIAMMLGVSAGAKAAGALAIGACGAHGEAHDFPNAIAARASALRKCQGRNCRLVATLKGDCAAFAVDGANPCGPHGFASGPHLGRAQNAALASCFKERGKDCMIRAFVCDGRR